MSKSHKEIRCKECKGVISDDPGFIPLKCPHCGADADDVDDGWKRDDSDAVDMPMLGSKYGMWRMLDGLLPKPARIAVGLLVLALVVATAIYELTK